MNQDPVSVSRVEWLRVFPVLNLYQAVRLAFRLRILIPSYIVLFCCLLGPFEQAEVTSQAFGGSFRAEAIASPTNMPPRPIVDLVTAVSGLTLGTYTSVRQGWIVLGWNVLLLGFFGLAIARSTATEFCQHTRTGVIAALQRAIQLAPGMLGAACLAIIISTLLLLPLCIGAIFRGDIDPSAIVLLAWPLLCLMSVIGVAAAIVTTTGWLLSISAVSTDQCSGADALSRGISYVLSQKLRTTWYFAVIVALATLVKSLTELLTGFALTALRSRMPAEVQFAEESIESASSVLVSGSHLLLQMLPDAVHLGTFLSGITIAYILLRQAEDGVQLREIDGAVPPASARQ